jgi:hypothetical protein
MADDDFTTVNEEEDDNSTPSPCDISAEVFSELSEDETVLSEEFEGYMM